MYHNLKLIDNTESFKRAELKGYSDEAVKFIKAMISMGCPEVLDILPGTYPEEVEDMCRVLEANLQYPYKYISDSEKDVVSQIIAGINIGISPAFYMENFEKYYIKFDVDRCPYENSMDTPEMARKLDLVKKWVPGLTYELSNEFAHFFMSCKKFDEKEFREVMGISARPWTKLAMLQLCWEEGVSTQSLRDMIDEYGMYDVGGNTASSREFFKMIKDATSEELELLKKEVFVNRGDTTVSDLNLILSASKWGYDASALVGVEDKKFVLDLMTYQREHPEYNIRINDFVDQRGGFRSTISGEWILSTWDGHSYEYDMTDDILATGIDLYKFAGLSSEQISNIISLYKEGTSVKTLSAAMDMAVRYGAKHPEKTVDVRTIVRMIESDMLKSSYKANKDISELRKDPFCDKIISEVLDENNADRLISMLNTYKNTDDKALKDLISENIKENVFVYVENIRDVDTMNEILYAAENGIYDKEYLSSDISASRMHALTDLYANFDNKYNEQFESVFSYLSDNKISDNVAIFMANYMKDNSVIIDNRLGLNEDMSNEKMTLLADIFSVAVDIRYAPTSFWLQEDEIAKLIGFVRESDESIDKLRTFAVEEVQKITEYLAERPDTTIDEKAELFKLSSNFAEKMNEQNMNVGEIQR